MRHLERLWNGFAIILITIAAVAGVATLAAGIIKLVTFAPVVVLWSFLLFGLSYLLGWHYE
jgi:hypothetical protein